MFFKQGHSAATACSSLCLHPWNKKPVPVDRTIEILKHDRTLLLQAQIAARKKSVAAYTLVETLLSDLCHTQFVRLHFCGFAQKTSGRLAKLEHQSPEGNLCNGRRHKQESDSTFGEV